MLSYEDCQLLGTLWRLMRECSESPDLAIFVVVRAGMQKATGSTSVRWQLRVVANPWMVKRTTPTSVLHVVAKASRAGEKGVLWNKSHLREIKHSKDVAMLIHTRALIIWMNTRYVLLQMVSRLKLFAGLCWLKTNTVHLGNQRSTTCRHHILHCINTVPEA